MMKQVCGVLMALFSGISAFAQEVAYEKIQPQQQGFYDKSIATIHSSYRSYVVNTAGSFRNQEMNEGVVRQSVKQHFPLLDEASVDALVFLVYAEASKQNEEEIRKQINEQKQKIRKDASQGSKTPKNSNNKVVLKPVRPTPPQKTDHLSDMSEPLQLPLEKTLERRKKIIEVMGNLMKKLAPLQDYILEALK